ncbi:quinon protein alcohol dehydrogenase-like superfamily [Flagelloscypha sp. PMI_526]|nr:quinon protein alcohol dehydrogenase-like superfamily [Flagelloscypha sp. PMI_526]
MPSASRAPNSTSVGDTASTALNDALKITKEVGELLGSVPYIKGAAGILVHILEIREKVIENDERCAEILDRVEKEKDNLIDITKNLAMLDHSAAEGLKKDLEDYERILKYIERVLEEHLNKTGVRAKISKGLSRKKMAGKLEEHERRLKNFHDRFTFNRLVQISTNILEQRIPPLQQHITGIVRFQSDSQRLSPCLLNTRLDIFDKIARWVQMATQASIFLLYGHPGTGKSTISKSLEEKLAQGTFGTLGAVFFCRRQEGASHSARAFWCQIAAGLMTKHRSIARALASTFQHKLPDVESLPIEDLFDKLIANPIRQGYKEVQPLVVIVDALDEFGGRNPDRRLREEFIKSLHYWTRLPSNCQLFLTSRQETDIQSLLNDRPHLSTLEVGEHATDQSSRDIHSFFEDQFKPMHLDIPRPWPEASELRLLVTKAAGLFIWARTVTEKIRDDRRFLKRAIQEHNSLGGLVALYTDILESLLFEASDIELFKRLSGAIITAKVPLSLPALSHLCQVEESTVIDVFCHRLRPILSMQPTMSFLHKSFEDFLASDACPEQFRCNHQESHQWMSQRCLAILTSRQLHFNMGRLKNSHQMNCEVPGLKERVQEWVRYSCRWFGAHLESSGLQLDDNIFVTHLRSFFDNKFFHWLEVMSIDNSPGATIEVLASISRSISNELIKSMIQDYKSFVWTFAQPVFRSYSQIYLSGIPLSPELSPIAQNGRKLTKNRLQIMQGGLKNWPQSLNTMHGHSSPIWCITFSPDGQLIVSGSDDHTLRLWDATTGAGIGEPLRSHSSSVKSVAFSPDGRQIVSGSKDKTLLLWDATTGAVIGEPLRGHSSVVYSVAFSPDGQHIVSGSGDKTVCLWDATTSTLIGEPLRGHSSPVHSVAFSPDGQRIVSGSEDKTLLLWDTRTGAVIGKPLLGHSDIVRSVMFSPDGQRIVSGSNDNTLHLWDATTGALIGKPLRGHSDTVFSVAFSPDGQSIVSGSRDNTLRLWDAMSGAVIGEPLRGHSNTVTMVAFSCDGQRIVSGSGDNTLRLWDATTGPVVGEPIHSHSSPVCSVAFSPDGQRIISGSDDSNLRLWDAATGAVIGEPLRGHSDTVFSVAFSPDGQRIVSGSRDNTLRLWDAKAGEVIGEPLYGHSSVVWSAAFSPDGQHIVSGSDDHTLRLWDATTGGAIGGPLRGHSSPVYSVAFSPDGQRIVSGSSDQTLRLWDATAGTVIREPLCGHFNPVTMVAFSPDGERIVSGSADKTLRLWDARTGKVIGKPLHGHSSWVQSVAFSPDGQHIVSGSNDNTLRLWDAQTGAVIGGPLRGHSSPVYSVAFSPDGQHIVSGSYDNTLRLWDVATAENICDHVEPTFPFLQRLQFTTAQAAEYLMYLKEDGWVFAPLDALKFWVDNLWNLTLNPLSMGQIGPSVVMNDKSRVL